MIRWGNSARNFAILMTCVLGLLGVDVFFIANGQETFSETIWKINEKSLVVALFFGILVGHFLSVPKKENDGSKTDK